MSRYRNKENDDDWEETHGVREASHVSLCYEYISQSTDSSEMLKRLCCFVLESDIHL